MFWLVQQVTRSSANTWQAFLCAAPVVEDSKNLNPLALSKRAFSRVCSAGMGCSAGVIAIGLAQRLLAGEPNSRALVVSTENITLNWYNGNERSMLIPNTLFRMGGAAILLSNRPADGVRAKYSLEHIVRVHLGADDAAYR